MDLATAAAGRIRSFLSPMTLQREELFSEPKMPAAPLDPDLARVAAGVLYKYINFGKGWRPRLFIANSGMLQYYKVYGISSEQIQEFVKGVAGEQSIDWIGSIPDVERNTASMLEGVGVLKPPQSSPVMQGTVNLQVASIRESGSDTRKLYIYHGSRTIECRCESRQQRFNWVQVLARSRNLVSTATVMRRTSQGTDKPPVSPDKTRELKPWDRVAARLTQEGLPAELVGDLQNWVVGEMQMYYQFAQKEAEKRRMLLHYVRQLEDEKRHLEDQVVQLHKEVQEATGSQRRSLQRSSDDSSMRTMGSGNSKGAVSILSTSSLLQPQRSQSLPEDQMKVVFGGRNRQELLGSPLRPDDYEDEAEGDGLHGASTDESGDEDDEDDNHTEQHSWETFKDCLDQDLLDWDVNSEPPDLRSLALQRAFTSERVPPSPGGPSLLPSSLPSPTALGTTAPWDARSATSSSEPAAASLRASPDSALSRQLTGELPAPAWLLAEPELVPRTALPRPRQVLKPVSLWSVVKDSVGRDLNRIWLPVYFNEPLSITQRCAEELEYSFLLDRAGAMPLGSVERLLYVAAFAVSSYSSTPGRTFKPFNPMLGETYEYVCRHRGFRFMCEKVTHSPNIFAMVAEGRSWVFEGDCDFRHKFLGYAIILNPTGVVQVTFNDGEVIRWNKVTTAINNIIIGKIYIDHSGLMQLTSSVTGMRAKVTFREQGFFEKNPHFVKGHVEVGGSKVPGAGIYGHWDSELTMLVQGQPRQVWTKAPPPEDPTRYQLTTFSFALNELPDWLTERLPQTDSRLRPDLRLLELGIYDEATTEKRRLEEKQRAARRLPEGSLPPVPRWFTLNPGARIGQEKVYKFTGDYWTCREARQFPDCRDLFGPS